MGQIAQERGRVTAAAGLLLYRTRKYGRHPVRTTARTSALLKHDLAFVRLDLLKIETRNVLEVRKRLEWTVFRAPGNQTRGLRSQQAQSRLQLDRRGRVDIHRWD